MKKIPFCKDCGAEIKDLNQNFCEKCGSPIPESVKHGGMVSTPASTPARPSRQQAFYRSGSLFDINRNYYILKEKYWDA